MKRQINSDLLNKWLTEHDDGLSLVMQKSGLSFYTIDRMRRGKYLSAPSKSTRNALCGAANLKEDLLFPPLKVGKPKAS